MRTALAAAELAAVLSHLNVALQPQENLFCRKHKLGKGADEEKYSKITDQQTA